jgi:hypothetical protein
MGMLSRPLVLPNWEGLYGDGLQKDWSGRTAEIGCALFWPEFRLRSQFAPAGWHAKIGEATIADAILDRIVHDSYMIEIHSDASDPSMREMYGINKKQ